MKKRLGIAHFKKTFFSRISYDIFSSGCLLIFKIFSTFSDKMSNNKLALE